MGKQAMLVCWILVITYPMDGIDVLEIYASHRKNIKKWSDSKEQRICSFSPFSLR
jgi:hypothetical protein